MNFSRRKLLQGFASALSISLGGIVGKIELLPEVSKKESDTNTEQTSDFLLDDCPYYSRRFMSDTFSTPVNAIAWQIPRYYKRYRYCKYCGREQPEPDYDDCGEYDDSCKGCGALSWEYKEVSLNE